MIKKGLKYCIKNIKGKIRQLLDVKHMQLHGVSIDLTHENISPALKKFFYYQVYESGEVKILSKHLSDDDVVMEIGAGIGFLSAYCAKAVGSGKVFAYEANPFMIDKIKETYKLNNVTPTIKNILLSNKEQNLNFYLEDEFWSSSTVKRSDSARCVQVNSCDVNVEIKNIQPNFLIIDIEGGEKNLLPMIDFKSNKVKKIIIEVHPHVIGDYEASQIVKYLIDEGFYINFKDSSGIVLMFERLYTDVLEG